MSFSDYIVYVDESGDPSLPGDPKYPVFVLTFVIVKKDTYRRYIIPSIQELKFEFFGHDTVNLHSYDIRQKRGDFTFLMDEEKHNKFIGAVNEIMEEARYVLISAGIRKSEFKKNSRDMYHMALQFCLERLNDFLLLNNQQQRETHVILESRGKKEDKQLREEFTKILNNEYDRKQTHKRDYGETPLTLKFAKKQSNLAGLQIADLVGHPIGSHICSPSQKNRAFDIINQKFFRRGRNTIGKKIFPKK